MSTQTVTKIPPMSSHLIRALQNRRHATEQDWKSALWSLPKHLQREVLFWSNEHSISCKELLSRTWQIALLKQSGERGGKQ